MGTRYLSKGSEMETRGPMSQSRFGADHGLAQRVSHSSRPNVARYSSCLSRLSSILQSDFQEMRALLESGQHVSEIKSLRSFFWSRSTSGNAWIMPPIVKFAGAVSSTEEHHTSVYRVSLRFQALFCLRVFCVELRIAHPSLFSVHISTSGSGIKLKNLIPEDSEIMIACSQGDTSRVWKLLYSRRANVNDVTNNNFTPLKVLMTTLSC
jgi:hypothetical protein